MPGTHGRKLENLLKIGIFTDNVEEGKGYLLTDGLMSLLFQEEEKKRERKTRDRTRFQSKKRRADVDGIEEEKITFFVGFCVSSRLDDIGRSLLSRAFNKLSQSFPRSTQNTFGFGPYLRWSRCGVYSTLFKSVW